MMFTSISLDMSLDAVSTSPTANEYTSRPWVRWRCFCKNLISSIFSLKESLIILNYEKKLVSKVLIGFMVLLKI